MVLREMYPKGTKVVLEVMDDPQAPPAGTVAVVTFVDDACQMHVRWATGSFLALTPDVDRFRKL